MILETTDIIPTTILLKGFNCSPEFPLRSDSDFILSTTDFDYRRRKKLKINKKITKIYFEDI